MLAIVGSRARFFSLLASWKTTRIGKVIDNRASTIWRCRLA